ncbi:MAG: glycosyltransferase family 2 protein [Pseudorhodobacter sp.]
MAPPPVSLIIVSRHRPVALMRALTGISQMDHPSFEVIVVADPEAAGRIRSAGHPVKLADFDEANISAARNIGLGLAAAPVVAFLDDDAVPEPTWLSRLSAPFEDGRVMQAGGYVRGRSGFAWQWRAMHVDGGGFDHPFEPGPGVTLHPGSATFAVKTQGTNCAFRRDALLEIGGFDSGYRFYLEEADVNLRLAARGGLTAVVPDAVVHHGFAASARRRADRVPTDLTEIGASIAHFLRRHAAEHDTALARHQAIEEDRLQRHVAAARLTSRDAMRLAGTFQAGLLVAAKRPADPPMPMVSDPPPFLPWPDTRLRPGRVISGMIWRRDLRGKAESAVAAGAIVTLFRLSPGFRRQRQIFNPAGWWEITGGRFGRAERDAPAPLLELPTARRARTLGRIAPYRPIE